MFSRSLAVVPLASKALRLNGPVASVMPRRFDHDMKYPAHLKPPTMDELLVPCGSWQEHYDNNQRRYNIHLIFGIGFFLVTIFAGKAFGMLDFYMFPPERPAPKKSA